MDERIANLKTLEEKDMQILAQEIRNFLVDNISLTGGHLGSNLGVVELTLILHQLFNLDQDKIIFDVGHQGYVHKILTGRGAAFSTLRQKDGLSGFLKRSESEYDVWEAGHSSTSISAACGFALSRDLSNKTGEVICVIGDGSLTNGMALEALNHLSSLGSKVIIVLNDNEMSISKNIGFIDDILKNLQTSHTYEESKNAVKRFLSHIPGGKKLTSGISSIKEEIKYKISPSQNFFNLMGLDYVGVIDGHDFKELTNAFNYAKQVKSSVVVHVKTIKGKGYKPAMVNSWHGVGPFDPKTGELKNKTKTLSYSKAVANRVEKLMQSDESIICITPAMGSGSELDDIEKRFPNRFTDVGIAEEHAITFSAGLALAEKKPFCAVYSTFLQRTFDQLHHDVDRHNAPVVIGVDRAGIVGEDGETHQGIYDLNMLLPMKNMQVVAPSNLDEVNFLVDWAFKQNHPVAIRYPKGSVDQSSTNDHLQVGKWNVIKEHDKRYIISFGRQISELRNMDIDAGLINALFLKPLDYNLLDQIKDKHLIVIEEHVGFGGLTSYIRDYLPEAKINSISLPNDYIPHGKIEEILSDYNLSGNRMFQKIKEIYEQN